MWTCKIQTDEKNFIYGRLASRHNITISGYPISWFKRGKHIYVILAGTIRGKEHAKKSFRNALRKERRVIKLEFFGDFGVALVREPLNSQYLYRPEVIWVAPSNILPNGKGTWHLASWSKQPLIQVISYAKKYYKGKLLSLGRSRIKNISVTTPFPNITKKQQEALSLAIENGYYEYPRKTKIMQLAKKSGVSYSTFSVHLRKAEKAIMPKFI